MSVLLTPVADVPARSALRASSSGDLVVPRTRRRIDDTAFSVVTPRAWNTLPTQLKLLRSTTTFRRQLKTFLFQSAAGNKTVMIVLRCAPPSQSPSGGGCNINLKLVFRSLKGRCRGNQFLLALSSEVSSGDIRRTALAYSIR